MRVCRERDSGGGGGGREERESERVCSIILSNAGETDWKILAIDINDPSAEKLNGGWIMLV